MGSALQPLRRPYRTRRCHCQSAGRAPLRPRCPRRPSSMGIGSHWWKAAAGGVTTSSPPSATGWLMTCSSAASAVEKRLVLFAERGAALVWGLLGAVHASAPFTVLDPSLPVERLLERLAWLLEHGGLAGWLQLGAETPPALRAVLEREEVPYRESWRSLSAAAADSPPGCFAGDAAGSVGDRRRPGIHRLYLRNLRGTSRDHRPATGPQPISSRSMGRLSGSTPTTASAYCPGSAMTPCYGMSSLPCGTVRPSVFRHRRAFGSPAGCGTG